MSCLLLIRTNLYLRAIPSQRASFFCLRQRSAADCIPAKGLHSAMERRSSHGGMSGHSLRWKKSKHEPSRALRAHGLKPGAGPQNLPAQIPSPLSHHVASRHDAWTHARWRESREASDEACLGKRSERGGRKAEPRTVERRPLQWTGGTTRIREGGFRSPDRRLNACCPPLSPCGRGAATEGRGVRGASHAREN